MSEAEKNLIRRNLELRLAQARRHHACVLEKVRAQGDPLRAALSVIEKSVKNENFENETIPDFLGRTYTD